MIIISEKEVTELLEWNKTFDAIEVALKKVSQGYVNQSPRTITKIPDKDNRDVKKILLTMPGYLNDAVFGGLGCKLVTSCSENCKLENPLPSVNANIMLFDDTNGILKAIVEGTEITTWRTAAASAVATKHLMKKSKQYKTLAILGCGVQGKSHAEAFWHFFKFQEIRLWNRTTQKAENLVQELNRKYNTQSFVVFTSNEDCVKNADVIITATFAASPIVKLDWVTPGVHINAVGAGQSHHGELEEKLYLTSDVFIDHWQGAKSELTGLEKLGVHFRGEIGSVISGDLLPAETPDKISIFQSLGMAVEDCAMARWIYDAYIIKNDKK